MALFMQNMTFPLRGEFIELHKLIKLIGAAESGGAAKVIIAEGGVRVNGAIEVRKACKIRSGQTVEIAETRIEVRSDALPSLG